VEITNKIGVVFCMDKKRNDYEYDYAYIDKQTGEFATAHISLKIGEERMNLVIEPSGEMDIPTVLGDILQDIQKNEFDKMRIDILSECNVFVIINGITKNITMKSDRFEVLAVV
jgi:hypothetical protein